jgi:FtsH-binding integral membrane protein
MNNNYMHTENNQKAVQQGLMTRVYSWMTMGMLVTALASMLAASTGLTNIIAGNQFFFLGLFIVELVMVISLSRRITKIGISTAIMVFLLYSAINGLTLSVIFIIYRIGEISSAFLVTAGTFAVMSIYGYTTKTDLSRFGSFLFMALIGLILASVANMFFAHQGLSRIITYAGVLIFIALTAYDTQRIKSMTIAYSDNPEMTQKLAIWGALRLYLDFINMFLFILRLGRR